MLGGTNVKKKPNYVVGQYYMFIKCQHAKNEHLFYNQGRDTSANMVVLADLRGERKNKVCNLLLFFGF